MAAVISRLLDPARILLDVHGTDHVAVLGTIAATLRDHPEVSNFDGFYEALLERDRLDTTCLGNGVALPHARTEHVHKIVLAVGRVSEGIYFEHGNETVKLLFMLGTPQSQPGDYLVVLSALCKLLKSPANREAFLNASTPEAFIEAVVAAEERLLVPVAAAMRG